MAQNPAIELLYKKKLELEVERDALFTKFTTEIIQIDTAIEQLSGKKVWEIAAELVYDDQNPDYIRGSIED